MLRTLAALIGISVWSSDFGCERPDGCASHVPERLNGEDAHVDGGDVDGGPRTLCYPPHGDAGVGPDVYPTELPSARNLFPLVVGSWTYDVVTGVPCDSVCMGSKTMVMERDSARDGGALLSATGLCGGRDARYKLTDAGVEELGGGDSQWILKVAEPIQEGATWSSASVFTFTWRFVHAVSVPAGTFHGCWRAEALPNGQWQNTYCPGVGLVVSDRANYSLVLRAYRMSPESLP